MINKTEQEIIGLIKQNQGISSKEIFKNISSTVSYATIKRFLTKLIDKKLLVKKGQGKSTRYLISLTHNLFYPIDIEEYYKKEIDERVIKENFNFQLAYF